MSRDGQHRGEHGSATLWALSVIIVLAAAVTVALAVAAAVIARHRAATAADLAALAGAGQLFAGAGAACDRAAQIARRHDAVLDGCLLRDTSIDVEVSLVDGPGGWLGRQVLAPARGRARAGVGS